jgi:hypothetical protein
MYHVPFRSRRVSSWSADEPTPGSSRTDGRRVLSFLTLREVRGMTEDEILRNELWGVFRLLELANMEAVDTLWRVVRIARTSYPNGGGVTLIPCRFAIGGHHYGAMVTEEQRDRILVVAGSGTAEDVLRLIVDEFLVGHLYTAVVHVSDTLVAALRLQSLPADGKTKLPRKSSSSSTVGACRYPDGHCQEPCGGPLCKTLGGTPADSCSSEGPDDDDGDEA